MTAKQHKNRKQMIKNVAEKAKTHQEELKQMETEALALEAAGKWAEAAIAWAAVADYATGKAKARAAGRQAAAKTRASAAHKAIEEQMDAQMEAEEAAKANRYEIERKDREQRALEGAADETRAATPEEMAAEAAEQQETESKPKAKAKKEPPAPRERDPRLPAVGTVIVKNDRHGAERVRCTIVAGGVEYGGTLYRTISAAAMSAAKDLGLASKSQDGYAFWGLKKAAPRPVSEEALAEARTAYTDAATRYGALSPLPEAIEVIDAAWIDALVTELRAIATGLGAAKKLAK